MTTEIKSNLLMEVMRILQTMKIQLLKIMQITRIIITMEAKQTKKNNQNKRVNFIVQLI